MAYIEIPGYNLRHLLPLIVVVSFFLIYLQIMDKMLIWMKIKDHDSIEFTKSGLTKNLTDFIEIFEKLRGEIIQYDEFMKENHGDVDEWTDLKVNSMKNVEIELTDRK